MCTRTCASGRDHAADAALSSQWHTALLENAGVRDSHFVCENRNHPNENEVASVVQEKKPGSGDSDTEMAEFYLTGEWHSVREAVKLFEEDPLLYAPGSRFLYTTHGYTLLSAVLEAAESAAMRKGSNSAATKSDSGSGSGSGTSTGAGAKLEITFAQQLKRMFEELGLQNTYLDYEKPLIPHRARYSSTTTQDVYFTITAQ